MKATLESASDFLAKASFLAESLCTFQIQTATDFLARAAELRSKPPAAEDAHFNILDALQFGPDETRHTQVLAWLFTPSETHAHGRLFFNALLQATNISMADQSHCDYTVRAEYVGDDAITDIVIYRKRSFIIAIENKINAAEGDNQITREQLDMDNLADALQIPTEMRFGIFMTPDGRMPLTAPKDRHWITLSHEALAERLLSSRADIRDSKLSDLVTDLSEYMKTWRFAE